MLSSLQNTVSFIGFLALEMLQYMGDLPIIYMVFNLDIIDECARIIELTFIK